MKTAIAAAQSAYDNLAAINKQVYDTVEKSVEQNIATVKSATSKAKAKARSANEYPGRVRPGPTLYPSWKCAPGTPGGFFFQRRAPPRIATAIPPRITAEATTSRER